MIYSPEAYKRFVKAYREVLLDLEFTEDHMVAEGEKVYVRWKARASLKGGKQGEIIGTD
ncbi:MAG: ester cyclase [Desulfosarcina sp.]|nr:ester cyclase [Desulfosarcina sp.]